MFINIYNASTEPEQMHTLSDLINILETFEVIHNKSIVFGGDFNVKLNLSLDLEGGKQDIKKKTIAKLIQTTDYQDLWDIWRIRNPKSKRYTFK